MRKITFSVGFKTGHVMQFRFCEETCDAKQAAKLDLIQAVQASIKTCKADGFGSHKWLRNQSHSQRKNRACTAELHKHPVREGFTVMQTSR